MNALDPTKGSSNLTSAMMYFNAITDYMSQLRECLGELRDDIEYGINDNHGGKNFEMQYLKENCTGRA